jgi:Domain of unknown function (DUF4386)
MTALCAAIAAPDSCWVSAYYSGSRQQGGGSGPWHRLRIDTEPRRGLSGYCPRWSIGCCRLAARATLAPRYYSQVKFPGSVWSTIETSPHNEGEDNALDQSHNRLGAICAITGSVLLLLGTYLHPMKADPNDTLAAFTEYAADELWVTSHLTQLAGVSSIVVALLLLGQQLESVSRPGLPRVAAGGAIVSLAVTSVLQAVDGIALKSMVDAWMSAPAAQKEIAFHAAFAVRQVEIGLATMASTLFGCTITVYGIALVVDRSLPKWMANCAIFGGLLLILGGVVTAYTGFSRTAMAINMSASMVLLIWMVVLGVLMWRGNVPA